MSIEKTDEFRVERDSMGEMKVPANVYYAAQTQRAVENFPISDLVFSRPMLRALGVVKRSAAVVNNSLGLLPKEFEVAIVAAAEEVESGKLDDHFVVDIFQTGSGTSSNMNTNEVVANRAKEIASAELAIHPNDHVNMSQSSNDVIPTAIHVAVVQELTMKLLPSLDVLAMSLKKKADEYKDIVKVGRTHLQDATPVTLGQEFGGYAAQIEYGIERVQRSLVSMVELPLGGTVVGTGLNTHPEFAAKVIAEISKRTGLGFIEARNHFEAQAAKDAIVEMSGQLKTIACSLTKIANDIRWMGSGPRCAIGELTLPAVQPGSSIVPGKLNPVIVESVLMVAAQVMGNDTTIMLGGQSGVFELNIMMPVMAYNLLQSIELLATSSQNFAKRCIDGIEANTERLHTLAEATISICTALAPKIGYDKSAMLAKKAIETGKPFRQIAKEANVMSEDELDAALDLMRMTKSGLL